MSISSRIESTLESWSKLWKDRLKGFLSDVLGFGIEVFADIYAKSAVKSLQPMLDKIEAMGVLTPEIKPLFDQLRNPSGEFAAGLVTQASNSIFGNFFGRVLDLATRPLMTALSTIPGAFLLEVNSLIVLKLRGRLSSAEFELLMRLHGIGLHEANILLELSMVKFPSDVVGPAWLRDPDKYGHFWDEVKGLGIDDEHIELIKEMTWKFPGVGDILKWVVKEVYNEPLYKEFGQDEEYPAVAEADARAAGIKPEWLRKHWIAHWDLPSPGQGFQMLHRGAVNEDQLNRLLKALDVMPFWRDKLTEIAWDLPNRIELRMMARYGLVDKAFLVGILEKIGLHKDYRSIAADMMLAMGVMTDLSARFRNGWIKADDIKKELSDSGLSPEIQARAYQWLVKNVGPERTTAERDLTKAEIVKGVKLGFISWEEGVNQLVAMGYDESEAMYILAINIEVATGSPENKAEFERLTQLYRASQGLKTKMSVEQIKQAEKKLAETKAKAVSLTDEAAKVLIDTIRRRRRKGLITRDQEIDELLKAGQKTAYAEILADNDDIRLAEKAEE